MLFVSPFFSDIKEITRIVKLMLILFSEKDSERFQYSIFILKSLAIDRFPSDFFLKEYHIQIR